MHPDAVEGDGEKDEDRQRGRRGEVGGGRSKPGHQAEEVRRGDEQGQRHDQRREGTGVATEHVPHQVLEMLHQVFRRHRPAGAAPAEAHPYQ